MSDGEIDKVFLNLDSRLVNYKREVGMIFLERVKRRTPVRTGHLQNSWGFTEKRTDIEIYNTAEYAEHVENGTERQAPRGMLRATLLEVQQISDEAAERVKRKKR